MGLGLQCIHIAVQQILEFVLHIPQFYLIVETSGLGKLIKFFQCDNIF